MGPPPCETLSIVRIGEQYYLVLYKEPMWIKFDKPGVGFSTQIYPVDEGKPSGTGIFHYITRWGIDGNMEVLIEYPAGTYRNNSANQTRQRVNRFQAPYLDPITTKFVIIQGDNLAVDVIPAFPGLLGAIWFYGWKLQMAELKQQDLAGREYLLLEDYRRLGVAIPAPNQVQGVVR